MNNKFVHEASMTIPREYFVAPPLVPAEDRSGDVGRRLLRLLSVQAERELKWVAETSRQAGVRETEFVVPSGEGLRWPLHVLYNAATSASLFAVLARFGESGRTMGGVSRERMEQMARTAVCYRLAEEPVPEAGCSP